MHPSNFFSLDNNSTVPQFRIFASTEYQSDNGALFLPNLLTSFWLNVTDSRNPDFHSDVHKDIMFNVDLLHYGGFMI